MGGSLLSKPAPVSPILHPGVQKQHGESRASGNRRLSFYQKKPLSEDTMKEIFAAGAHQFTGLPWFQFLVHTELCTMNYDGLSLKDDERVSHMVRMMENLKVPQTLKKPADELVPFIFDVKQLMHENPYHNFCHVTDVTQYMYTLILATNVAGRLRPIELAATYVGAVCHDLDHPGLSNAYQNSEHTALSRQYDGESPLENHHLTMYKRLRDKHGLLAHVESEEDKCRFDDVVSHMILATDMAKHGFLMKKIKAELEDPSFNPLHTQDGVNLLLQIALKCSDISNQARPWKVANRWNEAVYKEFYHEGDLDRDSGRDVAPLLDRRSNQIPKSTVGFIGFVVAPLYENYVAIMKRCAQLDDQIDARAVEECLVFLHKNKERYQKQADGDFVDQDEEDIELQNFPEDLREGLDSSGAASKLPGINGAHQTDEARRLNAKVKRSKLPMEKRET
ncbi:hypothetical protein CTAYLR_006940 [Chrysophaeum taylorii]|uniref:Phosphodiesterase n=1 Tax=Chrysophaeum taylorii TaxID=2483200 RepID=A0AAD7XM01_9STRA|nr:hypothetical protein CTAYLR_006940 [Chrysophaeum taylorii]